MSKRRRIFALIWISIAIVLRFYGSTGGDASIIGEFAFLIWTAPFGMMWQFWIYDHVTLWMPANIARVIGDSLVILTCFLFWFILIPKLRVRGFKLEVRDTRDEV